MKVKLGEKLDGWQTVRLPVRPRSRPGRQPRIGKGRPPEALLPFLDALANLLAAEVVSRLTGGAGSLAPGKSGTDSTPVRSLRRAVRDAAEEGS